MAPSRCVLLHFSSCKSPYRCRSSCLTCRSSYWGCVSSLFEKICEGKKLVSDFFWFLWWIFIVTCFPVGLNANEPRLIVLENVIVDVFGVLMMRCFEDHRGMSQHKRRVTFALTPLPTNFSTAAILIRNSNIFTTEFLNQAKNSPGLELTKLQGKPELRYPRCDWFEKLWCDWPSAIDL